uniref:protein MTO1 homolog, mitochondrial-like n=1 Tax=Myxine glutinosa TaxID=7769 RepID=UPI00358F418B
MPGPAGRDKCRPLEPGKPMMELGRDEAFLGVMVSDMLSGISSDEPYRMFTSRAEFRLTLRPDNADLRLTAKGWELGCVEESRWRKVQETARAMNDGKLALCSIRCSSPRWASALPDIQISLQRTNVLSALDILQYPGVTMEMLAALYPEALTKYAELVEIAKRLKIESVYAFPMEMEQEAMKAVRNEANLPLPLDLDYTSLPISLSAEVRERLATTRPTTIAAASRTRGVTPAAIVNLLRYVTQERLERSRLP